MRLKLSHEEWCARDQETKRRCKRNRRRRIRESAERTTAAQWEEMKRHYGYRCLCCGRREGDIIAGKTNGVVYLVRDHVVPLAKGGDDSSANSQPLCVECNNRKARYSTDFRPRWAGASN